MSPLVKGRRSTDNQAVESERLRERFLNHEIPMARWPRQTWTTIYTYAVIFVLFPLCCIIAYGWVRGWR